MMETLQTVQKPIQLPIATLIALKMTMTTTHPTRVKIAQQPTTIRPKMIKMGHIGHP